jgi:hypothetical protein
MNRFLEHALIAMHMPRLHLFLTNDDGILQSSMEEGEDGLPS